MLSRAAVGARFLGTVAAASLHASFMEFLKSNDDFTRHQKTKDELLVPTVMGELPAMKLPFVDRNSTIAAMLQHLEEKWDLSERQALIDKSANPLYGFHAISGGGKSYLIDVFMNLKMGEDGSDLEQYGTNLKNKQKFGQIFDKKTLRIAITFNKTMEVKKSEHDPHDMLCTRLLYSWVFSPILMRFHLEL